MWVSRRRLDALEARVRELEYSFKYVKASVDGSTSEYDGRVHPGLVNEMNAILRHFKITIPPQSQYHTWEVVKLNKEA